MKKKFNLNALLLFLLLTVSSTACSTAVLAVGIPTAKNGDYSLALMGVVVERPLGKKALANVNVELIDLSTQEKATFKSQKDGSFYFKLRSDRQYQVRALNNKGEAEDMKLISTVNRPDSDILYVLLESTPTEQKQYMAGIETYASNNSDPKGSAVVPKKEYEMPYENALVYRVQVMALKRTDAAPTFKGISVQTDRLSHNMTAYLTGNFKTYGEAVRMMNKLKQMGYKQAFVVAYDNDVRMKLSAEEVAKKYGK